MAFQITRPAWAGTCSPVPSLSIRLKSTVNSTLLVLLLSIEGVYAAPPVARDDSFTTGAGQQVNGLLSSNDESLDGPADSYSLLGSAANGSVTVNTDGSFSYTPNIGFAGTDSFSYGIDDGAGGASSALVTISVAAASDFISSANPILFTLEDTQVALGLQVAPDLYDGGALKDLIGTDAAFRSDSGGSAPILSTIPARTSSIAITGYSTQSRNTTGDDLTDDDYQLLNARINLIDGTSSGRVAFINHGQLSELDQYAWMDVPLGQPILADTSKVTGFYATGASNPTFSVVADTIQIVETHPLETAYVIEYLTSEGDSTNFLGAGNSVQNAGVSRSILDFPSALEPSSGKKGFIALNALSAAAGSNFAVEHKGFARLLIDLEARSVSGSIAAQRGENSANTVTYSFEDYPLLDQRSSGASPVRILDSSATILGDVTADASVLQNPTLYIDATGQLVIERASGFSAVFTSMYTAEYYERTGYSSIASFVSVGSADALFDASPVDGVDEFGDPINEFMFTIPASARVGLLQMSWDTIGGNDTNENMGMGFAVIDLESGISSGSITFIRTSSPDLLSWDGVPFGRTFFGATDGANALYQSNKSAGSFTDQYPETAQFVLNTNPDGSRTLTFTATSTDGTQNYRDYRGNANISWLGNEPFSISGVPTAGLLSHGAPDGSGGWEIDFADLPVLAYLPAPHESGTLQLSFDLSSTGESEKLELRIEPVVDTPALSTADAHGYVGSAFAIDLSVSDSADVDGSENQPDAVTLTNVPAAITLSSVTGSVANSGGGVWLVDRTSLSTLMASSPTAVDSVVTASITQIDQKDVDGDLVIEDGDNGNGVDEVDELTLSETFTLRVKDVPTVTSLLVNNGTPTITGTASPTTGETLAVTVNGVVYTDSGPHLVLHGDGSWTLTIPPANVLPENTYAVTAVLSHVDGSMGSDTTSDELIVDLTPPPIPGITSQTTMDDTPLITGTLAVATGNTLRVSVNGQTYTQGDGQLNDNGDGTWQLQIPAGDSLADSLYQITATLTDAAGNVSTDNSVDELLIDTLSPPSPGVTSQSTSDSTPVIEGTAILSTGDTLTVEVDGIVYVAGAGALIDNADGTWTLTIPAVNELVESVYDVVATVTDTALNASSDPSSSELTVDLTAPTAPAVTAQLTNQSTPVLIGTASVGGGETLSVTIAGVSYTAGDGYLTDNGDGTWSLSIPPINALSEGIYEVIAMVTDAAGNSTSDSSSNELEVDLTPPPLPTVASQITASDTPVVTGTANTTPGDVLSVEIDGTLYVAGDGSLVDNGDGTWVLTIPVGGSLTDGSYDVLARVTDAAGNVALDASSGELVVDLTPPPAPGVTSQTTSDTTPLISGTTEVATGLTLRATVNGVVYVAGDGHLIDNGDGTWDLTIPPVNALVDALYQVVVTLTDAAGNVSTDAGIDELLVDTTAPPSPGVTSLTTNDTTPVIQGTAVVAPNETLTVLVNSVLYTAGDGHLVDQGDGTWSLTIPPINILVDGAYDVTATVTDAALNTSVDPSSSELLVDTQAPASPTVVAQVINDTTPTVQGTATVHVGETLSVLVNGISYTAGDGSLVDNGDGTWELLIPAGNALPEGVFDVVATVTDAAGNSASDSSVNEVFMDLTAPVRPTVTITSDVDNDGSLSLVEPADPVDIRVTLSVDAEPGDRLDLTDGNTAVALTLTNADVTAGHLTTQFARPLEMMLLSVTATHTDRAGNSSLPGNDSALVDTVPPLAPVVSVIEDIDNNTTIGIAELLGDINIQVYLPADVVAGDTLKVTIDGTQILSVLGPVNITTGSVNFVSTAAAHGSSVAVIATVTDVAGNESLAGSDMALLDLTEPAAPVVNAQISNTGKPTIGGTVNLAQGESMTVTLNGRTYVEGDGALQVLSDGSWIVAVPVSDVLTEGIYDIAVLVTDLAGNSATDISSNELIVDLASPAVPTVNELLTNSPTPTITGTATLMPGETLSVTINGVTYTDGDGHLAASPDGSWMLIIPEQNELPDDTYPVTAVVTDAAGNSTSSHVHLVQVDTTSPDITAADVQGSTTFRPAVGGTTSLPDGAVVRVTDVDGNLVCEAIVIGGAWNCVPGNDLPEGENVFTASVVDDAGNTQAIDFLVSVSSDFDADGIPNRVEGFGDSDGDGVVDSLDLDSDNDGLPDRREGSLDTDGDGLADYLDQDTDNDGIADTVEALGPDENGDYLVDHFVDTDGNGLSDSLESTPLPVPDTDGDGIPDFQDIDSDQDGIPDIVETSVSDLDDDGRVDGFQDSDVNGVDDALQLIRVPLLDTDGDGLPDYRDLDSDNDGITDLVEVGGIDRDSNGIVDTATDINANGIPDSVDVLITLGQDVDGDGIDDIADASVSFGDDTDGDGILDAYDPDIDGDGRADTAVLDLMLGAAVPDTDFNGTPNFQQAIDGTLRTGLSGRGGCSIKPGKPNTIDPVLLIITCLALLGLASRSRHVRRKHRAMHDDTSMAERAEHVRVIVALVLLLAASFVSANGLQLGPYIGLGVGQSLLKPDASELSIEQVDDTDRAFSGVLGLDLTKRFAVEIGLDELGRARLTNDVYVDYQLAHASLLFRGFNDEQSLIHHRGTSLYGRLGLGSMKNHANFPYVREHDMHLMFGAGVEHGFSNGLSIRADLTTFDTDAHRAGLFVLYRPRFRSEQPEAVVATHDPLPTRPPVNRKPEPLATDVLAERKYFILFDQNSSIIDMEAKVTAVNVAATMRLKPELTILLTGYADVTGSAHYNRWLADRRVNRVRSLLELRGVDSARIDTAVVGETAKFSSSGQSAELRSDRRVQIEWVAQ